MRLSNDSITDDPVEALPSSQPTQCVESEEFDWPGIGGGTFGALVFLVVSVLLIARKKSARVREILKPVSDLVVACTSLIQILQRPKQPTPPQPPPADPHEPTLTAS